jgi:RNA polymerase sigma-70 factor, ECF subfamily
LETLTAGIADEAELVAKAQADTMAFAAVYDYFYPRVYNYVRYRAGDTALTDDLVAEIFERALVALRHYRPGRGSFSAWLFGIARHVVQDQRRWQRRHPAAPLDAARLVPADVPAPDDRLLAAQEQARLLVAVGTLKERDREVIALKFGAGLANGRIAAVMGLTENHVGVILFRALQALRRQLGPTSGTE